MRMNDKAKKIIRLTYGIATSVMLTVCGVLFAVSCYSIYTSNDVQKYTYESIGAAFDRIDVVVYITLAMIIIGAILFFVLPTEKEKLRVKKSAREMCRQLRQRVDLTVLSTGECARIRKERTLRRGLFIGLAVLTGFEIVLPMFFLLNPNSFPAVNGQYNGEVIRALFIYLALLSPLAIYLIVYYILTRLSYRRECEMLKDAMKGGAVLPAGSDRAPMQTSSVTKFFRENERPIILGARIALVGAAVVFIALGIANGGMTDVLAKAVAICAECIGLG